MQMQAKWLIMPPGAFRMVLAYSVVVAHTLPLAIGLAAVYLFFALSGFWILKLWYAQYALTRDPYRTFVLSRFWRLLPGFVLQMAVLITILLLFPPGHDRSPAFPFERLEFPYEISWRSLHMLLSNVIVIGYASLEKSALIMRPAWSLDIELQFYLVAPIFIWIITCGGRSFRVALWGFAGIGLIYYLVTHASSGASGVLPFFLIFFMFGMHAANKSSQEGSDVVLLAGFAIAVVVGALALPISRPLFLAGSFAAGLSNYNDIANVALALALCPYALATVRKRAANPAFDRDLGNVTYVVYLMHMSFVALISHFEGDWSRYQRLPTIIVCYIVLLPSAWAVYKVFDQPIDRLRHRYVNSCRIESAGKFVQRARLLSDTAD